MYAIQVIEDDIDRGRFCEGGKTVIYILLKETRSVIVVGQELTPFRIHGLKTTNAGHGR